MVSINGHLLATPDNALNAYARLRDARVFVLRLRRRGRSLTLTYRVLD